MTLTFDPAEDGLGKVLRDYQVEALRFVWEKGEPGVSSRETWLHVNNVLESKTISRASIINFLNAMIEEGVLNYVEKTGKGGYRRIYSPKLDEVGFKRHIVQTIVDSLLRDFPEEMREVITGTNLL